MVKMLTIRGIHVKFTLILGSGWSCRVICRAIYEITPDTV